DAVVAVHLDDPVGQQVEAVAQVVPEGGFLPQQQHRGGAHLLEQPAGGVGVVGPVGAEDAQVVVVHVAQVGHRDVGVQGGGKAPAVPGFLHGEVAGVPGRGDGVVKGVVDDGVAQGADVILGVQGAGQSGGHLQGQVHKGLLLPAGEQHPAQHAAVVGEGEHPVLLIVADGAGLDQALAGQLVQL